MPSRSHAVRPTTFISATAAAVLLVLAAAPATSAASIYTCVNRKSGTMRIVSAKTKCRHGEHRLSWSSSGPSGPSGPGGPAGAPGAAGKQGASGVGVDYASSKPSGEELRLAAGTEETILSKTLPAGSYFVSAQSTLFGVEAKTAVFVAVACGLADSAMTPSIKEPKETIDESVWTQQLSFTGVGTEYEASTDMALQGQLTTTAPTTLALICIAIEGTKEAGIATFDPQLSALQTTANA